MLKQAKQQSPPAKDNVSFFPVILLLVMVENPPAAAAGEAHTAVAGIVMATAEHGNTSLNRRSPSGAERSDYRASV